MKYSENYVPERNVNVVTIEIWGLDMERVKVTGKLGGIISPSEMAYIRALKNSQRISDKILAIQIMARKIEEA